jgi:hypothetical protein
MIIKSLIAPCLHLVTKNSFSHILSKFCNILSTFTPHKLTRLLFKTSHFDYLRANFVETIHPYILPMALLPLLRFLNNIYF